MGYYLGLGDWQGVFAVPNSFVDKHLKLADEAKLKIMLWALRHSGKIFNLGEISDDTGVSANEIDEALEYWIQVGLIKRDGNNMVPAKEEPQDVTHKKIVTPVAKEFPSPSPNQTIVQKRMLRPDGVYIAQRMKESPEISHILTEAELILGKTVSHSLAAVLINALDDYNLPCEVIIMLIGYVKSINKTSTAYIETLTKNWSEKGINSLQDAEKLINELNQHNIAWRNVSSILGIPYRKPSAKEDAFAFKWVMEFKSSRELINESYNRCVDKTGKIQMKYMNTILESWYNSGLKTLQEVFEAEVRDKPDTKPSTTYDINELDKMDVFGLSDS